MERVGGHIKPRFLRFAREDTCWDSAGSGDPAGAAMLLEVLRREPPCGETQCCGRGSCS